MDRRTLLQSLMSGLVVGGTPRVPDAHPLATDTVEKVGKSFIDAPDGARLFFQDWGKGRPLVFVAPWSLNSNWWEYQTAFLANRGFRCIAYDRRGHGRSEQSPRGYDFDSLADDLAALLTQLDLRDVMLVGHSMGCAEVVRYLARHGAARVTRAALIATITPLIVKTADNPSGADPTLLEKGRAALAKDRPHQIAIAAASFFGAPKNVVSTEIMEWWTRMMVDQCSLNAMLDLHRAFTETDFAPDLRRITVPTLLIHGDSDNSARLDLTSRRSAPLIRGSRLEVYEGAAHGLPVTHMERLNADLMAFANA